MPVYYDRQACFIHKEIFMTVTIEQVQAGIIKYIDTQLAPKADGALKFMLYFFTPSIPKLLSEKLSEFKNSPLSVDLFDNDGNIVLDEVYKRAKEAIRKSGKLYISKINYFADEQDLELLYNMIKST